MKKLPIVFLLSLSIGLVIGCASQAATQSATQASQSTSPAAPAPPPSGSAKLSAAELEKLVMPVALHPDPLIAILLPASVYPLEIVQAARFVKDTNNIPKVDEQPWDDNVKAVAKFPDLIAKMDADLNWTVQLGQAFLDQPKELMDTIQALRTKAHAAGTLQSNPQQVVTVTNVVVLQTNITQVVTVTNQVVYVQPSNPEVIYVPSYPPTVYYPPPAYVYNPYAPLITFGVGMAWGAILANNCDWHHGSVDVDVNRNVNRNVNRDRNVNQGARPSTQGGNRGSTGAGPSQQKWQPDQNRLRNSGAAGPSAGNKEARGWGSGSGSGSPRPSTQPAGAGGARPSTGTRPSTSPRPSTGSSSAGASRAGSSSSVNRSSRGSDGSAFGGMSSGSSSRSYSSRGSSSRSGGYGGGGSRGGGRGGRR